MSAEQKCMRPCAGCPWLKANQTPDVVAASPVDGTGTRWFEVANLKRHWTAITKVGAMLPCHETDINAPLYGGKAIKNDNASHICVGVSILARREMHAFMVAGTDFKSYRNSGGRFTLTALAAWASRFNYAGAVFRLGRRDFTMPVVSDDERVALPWAAR